MTKMTPAKQKFFDAGHADALAGAYSGAKHQAGGWQGDAYRAGWEAGQDEKAAPKAELIKEFAGVKLRPSDRRIYRDAERRTMAHAEKFERRQRLRAFDKVINRLTCKRGFYKNPLPKSSNIKRGSAWGYDGR